MKQQVLGLLLRSAIFSLAAGLLVLGLGFLLQAGWALALWPWPDESLSYLFVASIVLAEGATLAWTGVTLELSAARGGALGFAATNAGLAAYTGWLWTVERQPILMGWVVICGALALGSLGLVALGGRFPRRDTRPAPAVVRLSFLAFALALFAATAMLLARAPVVFPWRLDPRSSVMFGFFFLASAIYFFDGWLRPGAANATGQLIGFLVYDLVLIPPYLAAYEVEGAFRTSRAIYLVVLFWSAALAVWFLFLHGRASRPGRSS